MGNGGVAEPVAVRIRSCIVAPRVAGNPGIAQDVFAPRRGCVPANTGIPGSGVGIGVIEDIVVDEAGGGVGFDPGSLDGKERVGDGAPGHGQALHVRCGDTNAGSGVGGVAVVGDCRVADGDLTAVVIELDPGVHVCGHLRSLDGAIGRLFEVDPGRPGGIAPAVAVDVCIADDGIRHIKAEDAAFGVAVRGYALDAGFADVVEEEALHVLFKVDIADLHVPAVDEGEVAGRRIEGGVVEDQARFSNEVVERQAVEGVVGRDGVARRAGRICPVVAEPEVVGVVHHFVVLHGHPPGCWFDPDAVGLVRDGVALQHGVVAALDVDAAAAPLAGPFDRAVADLVAVPAHPDGICAGEVGALNGGVAHPVEVDTPCVLFIVDGGVGDGGAGGDRVQATCLFLDDDAVVCGIGHHTVRDRCILCLVDHDPVVGIVDGAPLDHGIIREPVHVDALGRPVDGAVPDGDPVRLAKGAPVAADPAGRADADAGGDGGCA
ncbi:hypothetical protein ASZ90_009403 [hydrocarbon metagenome]|uniref:Uncharacterized protein n=1 Tax=hydrocarbon metagenome TaxID=938273 RepID=A0A0W8FIW2_9ZZZZ